MHDGLPVLRQIAQQPRWRRSACQVPASMASATPVTTGCGVMVWKSSGTRFIIALPSDAWSKADERAPRPPKSDSLNASRWATARPFLVKRW